MTEKQIPRIIQSCADCGNEFETTSYMGQVLTKFCESCRSARARLLEVQEQEHHTSTLEYHRQQWITDPKRGIPPKYQGLAWEDFTFDHGGEGNQPKVETLKEYAAAFPVDRLPNGVESLLIARDVNGVGKTMLACLILKGIIGRFAQIGRERCPFQFWTVDRIKQRLQSANRFGGAETVEDVYRDLGTMWLLVIDDVGKEKMTGADASATYEMYFSILNERYNNNLPVVLTSNVKFDPWTPGGASLVDFMGRAGVSRLMEMTRGRAYIIEGEDRR